MRSRVQVPYVSLLIGLLVQLARTLALQAKGHEFESHTVRFRRLNDKPKVVKPKTCMDGPKSMLAPVYYGLGSHPLKVKIRVRISLGAQTE